MTKIDDFLDGEKTIAGMKFRPFTLGSKQACGQMNLTMFTTPGTELSQEETERQIIAFAWMHVKPLSEVLKALRENKANEAAQSFGWEIEWTAVDAMIAEINRISNQAKENSVEVVERQGAKDKDEPGNSVGQTG